MEEKGFAVSREKVKEAILFLVLRCDDENRTVSTGLELCNAVSGFLFRANVQCKDFVLVLFKGKPQRFTNAQLKILSIVAYLQLLTKIVVE